METIITQKRSILLISLYFKPIFAVEHAEKVVGMSYPNVNKFIKDLCELGILQEIIGQKRNRAFAYDPCLKMISIRVKAGV